MHDALQLAHIARPAPAEEGLDEGARQAGTRDERAHGGHEVVEAGHEGWDGDGPEVEAAAEIGPEAGVQLGGAAVGGGEEADVHGDFAVGADGPDGALLEQPEECDLDVRRRFTDFVEQQGAALGCANEARAGAAGTGECAGSVPEQLALEHGVVECAAVHGDEGTGAARGVVDGARHQFLAHPGRSGDADGDIGGCDGLHLGHEPAVLRGDAGEQGMSAGTVARRTPAHHEHGVAHGEPVAVGEAGGVDARATDAGAVAAVEIGQYHGVFGVGDPDSGVRARLAGVVGEAVGPAGGTAAEHGFAAGDQDNGQVEELCARMMGHHERERAELGVAGAAAAAVGLGDVERRHGDSGVGGESAGERSAAGSVG